MKSKKLAILLCIILVFSLLNIAIVFGHERHKHKGTREQPKTTELEQARQQITNERGTIGEGSLETTEDRNNFIAISKDYKIIYWGNNQINAIKRDWTEPKIPTSDIEVGVGFPEGETCSCLSNVARDLTDAGALQINLKLGDRGEVVYHSGKRNEIIQAFEKSNPETSFETSFFNPSRNIVSGGASHGNAEEQTPGVDAEAEKHIHGVDDAPHEQPQPTNNLIQPRGTIIFGAEIAYNDPKISPEGFSILSYTTDSLGKMMEVIAKNDKGETMTFKNGFWRDKSGNIYTKPTTQLPSQQPPQQGAEAEKHIHGVGDAPQEAVAVEELPLLPLLTLPPSVRRINNLIYNTGEKPVYYDKENKVVYETLEGLDESVRENLVTINTHEGIDLSIPAKIRQITVVGRPPSSRGGVGSNRVPSVEDAKPFREFTRIDEGTNTATDITISHPNDKGIQTIRVGTNEFNVDARALRDADLSRWDGSIDNSQLINIPTRGSNDIFMTITPGSDVAPTVSRAETKDSKGNVVKQEDTFFQTNGEIIKITTNFGTGRNIENKVDLITFADGKSTRRIEYGNDDEPDSVTFNIVDEKGRTHTEKLTGGEYTSISTRSLLPDRIFFEGFRAGIAKEDILANTQVVEDGSFVIKGKDNNARIAFDAGTNVRTIFIDATTSISISEAKATLTEGTSIEYHPDNKITVNVQKIGGVLSKTVFVTDEEGNIISVDGNEINGLYGELPDALQPNKNRIEEALNKLLISKKLSTRVDRAWQNRFLALETSLQNAVGVGQTFAGAYKLIFNNEVGWKWAQDISENYLFKPLDEVFSLGVKKAGEEVCDKRFTSPIGIDKGNVMADTAGPFPRPGAHIEATRTPGFKSIENDEEIIKYIYYITFDIYLGPPADSTGIERVNLNAELTDSNGNKKLLFEDYILLEKELENEKPNIFGYFGAGEDGSIVKESITLYESICIIFDQNPFPKLMERKKVCTKIAETAAKPETLRELKVRIEEKQEEARQRGIKKPKPVDI